MEHTVVHDDEVCRFEVIEPGQIAYLQYQKENGIIDILHIIVPQSLEGQGIATSLMKELVDYAIKHHLKIIPTCLFAKAYFKRHVEYKHLLV